MKKKFFTLMFALVAIATTARAQVVLNAENFPDANFRAALASKLEISEGDEITNEMIEATTSLYIHDRMTSDLKGIEYFTALETLDCQYSGLVTLDISKNVALKELYCRDNKLTQLDVTKNIELTNLQCQLNQIAELDVSQNPNLIELHFSQNKISSLDVSNNPKLTTIHCDGNQLKGKEMDKLVESLPVVSRGSFYVFDSRFDNEGNIMTKLQVAAAKAKGWTVYNYVPHSEYEGSDPIDPIDENNDVDFGDDLDDNSDLNGNVIGNIFYNIGDENGEYSSAEGCIVVKKSTSDENMDGTDIFGEEFKKNFTGIVFKVPAGNGTIKVNAETTGNMTLKVKIGNNAPVEMELEGKLKATFPYNVSEPTYVYIYAGAANEAKGFGKASSTDAALKIYGIEFEQNNTPTDIDASLNDNGQMINDNWYTINGVKLNGKPTKKGVYIVNGKKVVK